MTQKYSCRPAGSRDSGHWPPALYRASILIAMVAIGALAWRHPFIRGAHAVSDVPQGSVIELFTSHGCSSCPPADRLLADLIREQPDLVALEYHVTYWDTLVHGDDGSFRDPFSRDVFTDRQRTYHASSLGGRAGVYTPQMIVNGQYAVVGSRADQIDRALQASGARDLELTVRRTEGMLEVSVQGHAPANARAWLAVYDIEQSTQVTGGENRGRLLVNHHVVREMVDLGDVSAALSRQGQISLLARPDLSPHQGCAVVVQHHPSARELGTMLGAARCPVF